MDAGKCPKCESTNIAGYDGLYGEQENTVTQHVGCGDCGHDFTNFYELTEQK